jgi:hypothetical protein
MDTDSRPCIFVSSIMTGYGTVRAAASHALITERKSYSNDWLKGRQQHFLGPGFCFLPAA